MPSSLLPILRSLSFSQPQPELLRAIGDSEWRRLLGLTDRSQLTLPLGARCLEYLPKPVGSRIQANLSNNAIRQGRIVETYENVASILARRGIEFLVLKGFSHYPLYCADLRHRPQYDLDLYCPPERIQDAYAAIQELGYEPFGHTGRSAIDHLPPLILKTGWRAKDDYYDPDIPITIEVHFRFWDEGTERFGVSGVDRFWERRQWRQHGSLGFHALHPADAFSYATWHLLRHLLRGDTRAYHVYELAHFLGRTATDDAFWRDWRDSRPSPLPEVIACRLAVEWFGCPVNPVVREFIGALPPDVERWFEMFGFSPLEALERPNKDELFLHLCLVKSTEDRLMITRRRLFPRRANPYIADVHVAKPDARLRLKRRAVGAAFVIKRAARHAGALFPVVWNGLRWRRALSGLQRSPSGRTLHPETVRR